MLDLSGHVVGINTAIAGQAQNIGFAISIDQARAAIDQLRSGQVPEHPLLGVSTTPADGGAGVADVQSGSAADRAGLRVGDIVTAVDGTAIATPDDLATAVAGHRPGDHVTVSFTRGAERQRVTVSLGSR